MARLSCGIGNQTRARSVQSDDDPPEMADFRENPRRIWRMSKVADIRCADRIWAQIRDPYPPKSAADIRGYPRADLFRFKYARGLRIVPRAKKILLSSQ